MDATLASALRLDERPLALIKGAGDLATGVALRLHRAGFAVVMTEIAEPTVVRRTVAFAEAVYEGAATVEGVGGALRTRAPCGSRPARARAPSRSSSIRRRPCGASCGPPLLVDAIMAKRNLDTRISDAPAVVALGPGLRRPVATCTR